MIWLMLIALAFGQEHHPVEAPERHPIEEVADRIAEVPQPETPAAPRAEPPRESAPVRPILPWLPFRGFWAGLLLTIIGVSIGVLAIIARRFRSQLAPVGLLPNALTVGETALRVTAAICGVLVIAAWAPASLAPLLPWVLVFGAAALGWSLRDVAPDLIAWATLSMEGRVRPGKWVSGGEFSGRLVSMGFRSTLLHDSQGREISVPNRLLLQAPLEGNLSPWPAVEVELVIPDREPAETRRALHEAVLLSPWVAPGAKPELRGDTDGTGRWLVRVRLLSGDFASPFEGTLRERVFEILDHKAVDGVIEPPLKIPR